MGKNKLAAAAAAAQLVFKFQFIKPKFLAIFSSGASCVLSSILTLLLFSAMQMYKPIIATSAIWGGFMGSLVFFFALTVNIIYLITSDMPDLKRLNP